MSHLQELQRLLKPYFKLSSARLECLCHMIIGLLAVNNVNLTKIAKSFCSNTLTASSYKRTQRFLKGLNWSSSWLWDLIESCCDFKGNLHLALDRTNWKFGKLNINILTLAVCYRGIAIPFVWLMLSKQGNSDWKERFEVLKRLVNVISPTNSRSQHLTVTDYAGILKRSLVHQKSVASTSKAHTWCTRNAYQICCL